MKCNFCGMPLTESSYAVAGKNETYICDDCVEKSLSLLIDIKRKNNLDVLDETSNKRLKPEEIKAHLDQYVIGQDKAKEVLAVALYNHYKRLDNAELADTVELDKSNVLLIGPTGTGKTFLIKTLAKLFDVPFAIADANSITQAGYVGEDAETMLQKLIQNADGDIKKAERGIIFIDEIDKISRKSENVSISRDVSGEGTQQALLKLIEGSLVDVQVTGARKNPHGEMWQIDTSKILFICGGSFEGIESVVNRRNSKTSSIGFGGTVVKKEGLSIGEAILQVTTDDLRKFGMIPELLGRLPIIAPMQELDIDTLRNIITEPKNSILKQYMALFKMDDIDLTITEEAIDLIAEEAIKRKTGARSLRGIMETLLTPYMYKAPSMEEKNLIIEALDIQQAFNELNNQSTKQTNKSEGAKRA